MSNIIYVDAWEHIKTMRDNSVDLILTDPPYKDKKKRQFVLDMNELRRICRGHIISFCDPRFRFFIPDEVAVWKKPESSKNASKHLSCFFEEILVERHGNIYNYGLESANYNGFYYDMLCEKRIHPHQKPLSLLGRIIKIYSEPNALVFDPFAGSGSTISAALLCGRRGLGCEIDTKWQSE